MSDNCNCLNCHLKAQWKQYYELSEKMILKHPETYQQIITLLDEVCETAIDIDAYFETANQLSRRLHTMGKGTIFYNYFYEQMDPNRYGDARFFRTLCRDLREQVHALNQWRKKRRHLRLIQK